MTCPLSCGDKQRQSLASLLPLSVRPLHGAELMEELLAGEPGCQQILVLGDEVVDDLFLHTSGLQKNQETVDFYNLFALQMGFTQSLKKMWRTHGTLIAVYGDRW